MSDKKLLAKAVLFSSVCGILILVILMCLLAAVMMSSGVISADILDYCTVGMVGVATLMSGIISSRITGSAGLAVGSLTGFFIFLVITSIALIFNGEPITILTLLKLMSSVLGGGIGGIIGVNKKEKIKIEIRSSKIILLKLCFRQFVLRRTAVFMPDLITN